MSWRLSAGILTFCVMMIVRRIRFLLVALAFAVATLGVGRAAYAGVLQVRDQAHLMSADDVGHLRSTVAQAPFDARLLVTTEFSDAQDLSRFVGSLVSEPNMVVVGLDPQHRHVQVHFGTGSGVARSEWPAIERAGNDAFRRGDWEGGVAAIYGAAAGAVTVAPGAAPTRIARPSLLGPGTMILLVMGAIGLGLYFAWRRSTYGAQGYGPQGYGGYGNPPYPGGGYPPGYPPQGGIGPVGGGLIGAGLGGLAGYELGKMEGEREVRDRDREGTGGSFADDSGGNYDEGGGGSGWDDGGGGGGFDGGGGDGGGGGDF